jgi:2-(1,2-epoxy-1,2-dihydrophenyl)acetyl-CoA isomerase
MPYETITLRVADGIATIALNRPDALNALTLEALLELKSALKQVVASQETRCLVLTGTGRGFCTGVDLTAPRPGLNTNDRDEFLRDYFVPPYELLADLSIPTIAAVNGPCAGAGMSLALTCDIVVAAESAYFLQPFANIGLVPDMGSSWLLPQALGRARAAGLMLLGERLPARTAADWGLIWKCVADDALEGEVHAIAAKFASGARTAQALIKQLLRQAPRNDLRSQMRLEVEYQGIATQTKDFVEAKQAFAEKRRPVFQRD